MIYRDLLQLHSTNLPQPIKVALTLFTFKRLRTRRALLRQADQYRRRENKVDRDRAGRLREIDSMADGNFRRMFGMDRSTMSKLLEDITPHMPVINEEYAWRSTPGSGPITNSTKLYCAIRFLRGGNYLDIAFAFGIGFGSFFNRRYGPLLPVLHAIDCAYTINMPLNDEAELDRISKEFADIHPTSADIFNGGIGAIDGLVIETRQPYTYEVDNVRHYRNRKGVWGIVILAICDAKCRILMWNANNPGSTNDCVAWERCPVHEMLESEEYRDRLRTKYLFGDDGFSTTRYLLTPWSGRGLSADKDTYNFCVSVRRQTIERTFGIYMKRWGVFSRPLQLQHSFWGILTMAAAKLHNLLIDRNVPVAPPHANDLQPGDNYGLWLANVLQEDQNGPAIANVQTGERRRLITQTIQQSGIHRPRDRR